VRFCRPSHRYSDIGGSSWASYNPSCPSGGRACWPIGRLYLALHIPCFSSYSENEEVSDEASWLKWNCNRHRISGRMLLDNPKHVNMKFPPERTRRAEQENADSESFSNSREDPACFHQINRHAQVYRKLSFRERKGACVGTSDPSIGWLRKPSRDLTHNDRLVTSGEVPLKRQSHFTAHKRSHAGTATTMQSPASNVPSQESFSCWTSPEI